MSNLFEFLDQQQKELPNLLGQIRVDNDLKQKQKEFVLAGLPVIFPQDPYASQTEYMTSLIRSLDNRENALLQSPTGTGKTLALLCATLAWLKKRRETHPKEQHPVRVIYLSRTHLQLKQVIKELKRTAYKPNIVVAASRDHSCCNNQLRGFSGNLKELECIKRISGGDVKCKYHRLEGTYTALAPKVSQWVMDLQELVEYGQKQLVCPFYYSRKVKERMDVVFMPYNYLLDRNIARLYNISCTNAIIVLDEGHNVPSESESCTSQELSTATLATALEQLGKLKEMMLLSARGVDPKDRKATTALSYLNRMYSDNSEGVEFKATVAMVEDFIKPINNLLIHFENRLHEMFTSQTEMEEGHLMNLQALYTEISRGVKPDSIFNRFAEYDGNSAAILYDMRFLPNWAVDRWIVFVREVNRIAQDKANTKTKDKFKALIKMKDNSLIMSMICLDPSLSFDSLKSQQPYSFVITSGTLSPLNFWQFELGLKFPRPLACPHFITDDQLLAAVLTSGPMKQSFNFNYDNREKREMLMDLGKVLLEICRVVPGGVVVLFSSYGLLTSCQREFSQGGIMQQFYAHKEVFNEDKSSISFKDQLKSFSNQSKTKKGAVMFAVTRGKISEGIDLCDDQCRAVVMVGVPYLPVKDKKIQAKRSYLDSHQTGITGKQWYLAEAYRSINQAVGRAIRNPKDFGAIYLIDQRFENKDIRDQLSEWVRTRLEVYYDFVRLMEDTKKFFNSKKPEVKTQKTSLLISRTSEPAKVQADGQIVSEYQAIPFKRVTLTNRVSISKPSGTKRFVTPLQPPVPPRGAKSEGSQPKPKNQVLKALLEEINQQESRKSIASRNVNSQGRNRLYDIVKPVPMELKPDKQNLQLNKSTQADKKTIHSFSDKPSEEDRSSYKSLYFESHNKDIEDECPVCKTKKKLIRNKACSHSLCMLCWEQWLKNRLSCPICRQRVRKPYLIDQ